VTDTAIGPSVRPHATSNRIRRHKPDTDASTTPVLGAAGLVPAPPAAPDKPPQPLGNLSTASVEEIATLAAQRFGGDRNAVRDNRRGMTWLLDHLADFPGQTWQQRWEAAGLNERDHSVGGLAGEDNERRVRINAAARDAYCIRLIQPSREAFRATRLDRYVVRFCRIAQDPLLEEFCTRLGTQPVSTDRRNQAMFDICGMLTVYGIALADLTAAAVLHYADQAPTRTAAASAWPILYAMGLFPSWVPRTLQDARIRGRISIEDLVDRHQLGNREVRDLLVDYVRRRSVELDYSSMENLVRNLVTHFWKVIEDIPDEADLRLDEATMQEWKQRLLVRRDGKPRLHIDGPFLAVRAFYLDLQTWAAAEPERWARWVAPSPIRDADLRWFHVRRRRLAERMANRTRDRQPLPTLSQYVTDHWQRMRTLLDTAGKVGLGEQFVVDGVTWQRASSRYDQQDAGRTEEPIRAINRATGELVRVSHEERLAFWQWAIIETLRLAGLRREELVELTHLSVRQYQRPNGEVVALLVVSPSKSDRERVIPMSAELFHVIAQVIRRHMREHGTVPVCPRYDQHERDWCQPLPYLFQGLQSGTPRAMSTTAVRDLVRRAVKSLVPTHPEFAEVRFSPHDFRRLFATDLVNNGLPIHIGAALLGHLNVQTTRGYVAVFAEDVIAHYQQFIDRRRAVRPQGEYRQPTAEEWNDFQEHFDKRKVELGSCGRPYGTPCAHEFACVRCPMLSINPRMLPRLDELEQDLLARRQRAIDEGWRGEVEGLELTLTFLRGKRAQAQRAAAAGPVSLGIPTPRHPPAPG
jgi:site-specific recombinase XerD